MRINVLRRRTLSILGFLTIAVSFIVYGNLIRGTATTSQPLQTVASPSVTTKFEVELITIRPSGFEPAEIIRPKGPFVLLVDDRSGKEDSSFKLQVLRGEKLREVHTMRMKSEWHDVIDLPPGNYLLIDAANPESHCQITITP